MLQNSETRISALRDRIGKARDDRVFQAFAHHLLLHRGNLVGELASEIGDAAQCFVRVEFQLDRKLAPVITPDVAKPVLATDLHRYFRLLDVDVGVRKNAGHVIEGCQANSPASADQKRVVLCVGIRSGDEPVVDD